jgi:hypothetical protein
VFLWQPSLGPQSKEKLHEGVVADFVGLHFLDLAPGKIRFLGIGLKFGFLREAVTSSLPTLTLASD